MKKRIAKKKAKLYLDGKLDVPTFEDQWNYTTNGDYVVVDVAILHPKVERYVLEEAERRGWHGGWMENPIYTNIRFFNSFGERVD